MVVLLGITLDGINQDRFIAISQNCFSRIVHLPQTSFHSARRCFDGGSLRTASSRMSFKELSHPAVFIRNVENNIPRPIFTAP